MTAPLHRTRGCRQALRRGDRAAAVSASRIEQGNAPIVAVAGESGSGKTTLASLLLGFLGAQRRRDPLPRRRHRDGCRPPRRRDFRREVQAVFQDPFAVYNPFYRVDHALTEPLHLFGLAALPPPGAGDDGGGVRARRLASARHARPLSASAFRRPAAAPDGGPRAAAASETADRRRTGFHDRRLAACLVLGSLRTLNADLGIPILYITHDLTTAYHVADTIIVLYRGTVVEAGDAATVIQIAAASLHAAAGRSRSRGLISTHHGATAGRSPAVSPALPRHPRLAARSSRAARMRCHVALAMLPPLYAPGARHRSCAASCTRTRRASTKAD